ncbi:MAG: site-specific integrase [Planctomycetaceae bacterium]|nr:site-specific integrase [Planctomycetales bacterium]MCB9925276.1 site-specific integrase [Planctomycetaceae bacterium]
MPRKPGKVPSYCLHKASGRAVVRINGRDCYLGPFGSPESHAEYERLVAEWRARNAESSSANQRVSQLADPSLTIAQVLLEYRSFARNYYVKNGSPTKELDEMRFALRPLRKLYGDTLARDFGPLSLKALRQHLVDSDLSRGVINNRVDRIKRFFRWAVSEELVPPSVYEGLKSVAGLKHGRTEARETDPVKPVDDVYVDAVIPHVARQVAAMIQLQRLTGMRPCEAVMIRACDIQMSSDVWIYELQDHKTAWRGHRRQIAIGPKAQAVLQPFLTLQTEAYLFNPKDAEAERNAKRRENRKSPMTPSQASRTRKKKPKREKRDRYDVDSYRRAIKYGIKKVNKLRSKEGLDPIPNWFPLQLRHSRATELNQTFGIEAAAVSLGHAHADVTKVYAERNLKLAMQVARKTG